jgi:O-acetyl-ADP-ribose deacetylase (regulator of RNase III)
MERAFAHGTIEVVKGNIVEQEVDAIVNAANTKLAGGGGVDGAIHRAAGPELLAECQKLPTDEEGRRCPTGEVRVTGAGKMAVRHIIHAVGPYYNEQYAEKCEGQLRAVHENALRAAAEHGCASVAFPGISTGAYRFPMGRAAEIAVAAVAEFLGRESPVKRVRFVLFTEPAEEAFRQALERYEG